MYKIIKLVGLVSDGVINLILMNVFVGMIW